MRNDRITLAAAIITGALLAQSGFAAVPVGSTNTTAQPIYDGFGYYGTGSGDLYNQGPWKTTIASTGTGGSGSINQVQVINDNLSYNGLPTSPNGVVDLNPAGMNPANTYEGLKLGIGTVTVDDNATTEYFSFLIKATDLTTIPTSTTATALAAGSASATIGSIVAGFNTDRVANTMTLGDPFVRIRRNGGSTSTAETNWQVGLQKDGNITSAAGVVWESGSHALNDTVMVVARYKSNSGANNDQMDLWVSPDMSKFGLGETNLLTNVPPTLTLTSPASAVDRGIQDFFLRRQADGAHSLVDEVRISNNWADVAPLVWRGDTGGDANTWGTSTNWQTGAVPNTAGIRPTFQDISTASKTPNLTANTTVGGMTFNSATPFTLSADAGVSLTISSTDSVKRPASGVGVGITFGNAAVIGVSGGTHTISAPITGSSSLIVQGSGTLRLTNAGNNFTGPLIIGAGNALGTNGGGTVAVSVDSALGTPQANPATTPSLYGDGGTLQWLAAFDLNANRSIQVLDRGLTLDTNGFNSAYGGRIFTYGDASPLTKAGNGTFQFSGAAGSYRSLILKGGTFSVLHTVLLPEAPAAAVRITFDGGTLRMNDTTDGSGPDWGANRQVAVTANGGTINLDNTGSSIISGVLSNAAGVTSFGGLTKTGAGTLTLANTANTWSGALTISQGTVNAASFAAINTNSAIGKGSPLGSAADLMLNGGTLQYTGGTAQSTNRLFSLGAASSAMDASGGAGASLAFTSTGNVGFTGSGARTLTLTGSNTDANTIAAVIGDGTGGATAVSKTGAGKWILSGTNSYTGGTSVSGGRLVVNRLHENNAVSISNNATLQVVDSSPTLPNFPSGQNAAVSRPGSMITIANDGAPLGTRAYSGTLDLGNNDLIVDYSGSSPFADLNDMVRSGFNFGDWLGKGVTSSTAANPLSNGNYALGIAENGLLTNPFGNDDPNDPNSLNPKFDNQTVDNTTVLVKFTHRVDLDLNGLVDGNDAAIFNGSFSEGDGGATWQTGDVDYDGVYSSNDAAIFNSFYDESLGHLPEPGALSLLAVAGLGLARRRRSASR